MESRVHISVLQKNNIPQLTRCTVCCTKYHCPLCPPSMYKARSRAKVLQHMEVHVNNAIRHQDFFITKCHQACRSGSSGHFHCPFCLKTTIKRQDTLRHLQICRPSLHDAQLDADAALSQKDITSQTEECKAGSVNLPHLSNDKLPVTVHDSEMQGPDHPAETPQDPSPESVLLVSPRLDNLPCRVPRAKPPNILCPHCNVQLLRKNFKKHLYRKHPDKPVGDIAADADKRNEKDVVKKSFLGPLLSLDLQKETWGKGPQIKCESSDCQVSELGIAAAWSLPSHACAYPPVHISVIKKNNTPRSTRCTVCCTKYHCPLCPPSMYKARNRAKVLQHMEVHIKNAIRHQDFFITKCHQACRSGSSGHFHCPFCLKTTIKRQDTLRHLQICRPPLHDTQLDADADLSQKDITSQTEECKTGSVNLPPLTNDKLPVTVHDSEMPGPGDPAERPQDPSPESVLLFNSRAKPPTILCPHCNVQLQRKNLKKHLYRKHSDKAVGDVAANSHADADERNEKDAVKKSFLGPLLQLELQKETWGKGPQIKCESSECQVSEAGMAAAWSLPSHACAYPTVQDSEMQGPGDPAERPQDPSPESVLRSSPCLDNPPCRVPRGKPPNILCPHCNVQLLRKNLKMHIYRKHPDKAVGDIAAHSDLDAECIDERNGKSQRKPGAKRTKSSSSPVSANGPGRERKARKLMMVN